MDKIEALFEQLCNHPPSKFEELLKLSGVSYETLAEFASWSPESYKRICLRRNEDCELVLICWMPGQETKIHNHDNQTCWVYFAKGNFEECIYENNDPSICVEVNAVPEGAVTTISSPGKMHTLKNVSSEFGMSLHCYAQPIKKCSTFDTERTNVKQEITLVDDTDLSGHNSAELAQDLEHFLRIASKLIEDEKSNPIAERIPSEKLATTLDIQLKETGSDDDHFYKTLEEIVLATPKTASRLFFNQLFGGRTSKAMLGDLLAVMLNNSMYTYKVAGVQVGIEKEILNQVIDKIGYGSNAGGTFPTGGSMSNFMAMLMARDRKNTSSRHTGNCDKLIAYTSRESHYSVEKNASFAGIGRNNVRKIETDELGRLDVRALDAQIREDIKLGLTPFFINATAGTTVLGAFDPFLDMAEIADKHGLWFHIDGAYSGAVLFSAKYKHLISGVGKSDSFSFNPHKMLGTPLICSMILVNDKEDLKKSFGNDAEYLYQTDDDEYNLGKTSLQCGRRNDALKLWTLWKSVGTEGLEKIVDHQFALADVARDYIRNHPDYKLYSFDDSISVCFNYKDFTADELCTGLYESNQLMIGFGKFGEDEFIRLVTVNANNSESDILNLFQVIESFASKLISERKQLQES